MSLLSAKTGSNTPVNILNVIGVTLSLSVFQVGAVTFNIGEQIQQCLSLPAYGESVKNQMQCKEELKAASEKSLKETIAKIHSTINEDYNSPFHLNDPNGALIKDAFWEKFDKSQTLWVASRNELCAASATLVGEWAASQDDIQTQCIVDQNRTREQLLKTMYME